MPALAAPSPAFVDAQAMHAVHPDTFAAPSAAQLARVAPGASLKVGVRGERFWCVAVRVDGERVVARVDNDLVQPENRRRWRCGDPIAFARRHVLDVKTAAELRALRVPAALALDERLVDFGVPLLSNVPDAVHAPRSVGDMSEHLDAHAVTREGASACARRRSAPWRAGLARPLA